MNGMLLFSIFAVAVFVATAVGSRFLIPVLKSKKMGQKILEMGPRWHKSKEGTPTMGGLTFLIAATVAGIIFCLIYAFSGACDNRYLLGFALTIALGFGNGVIGIIDDLTKFKKSKNEGLTPPQKFFLQLFFAALYLFAMHRQGLLSTVIALPFTSFAFDAGIFYYALAIILITGIVNSVNLTDGLDGLCSMVTFVIGAFFAVCGISFNITVLTVLGAVICGSCGGFLVYNFYPARVFMGDTGSLFLGGLVAGGAFMLDEPFIIIIAGLIYIVESLSVIIQVGVFKLTGKRVFKMSPIHHHFERCDWSEIKIDVIFSVVTAVCCTLAYFMLK